MSSLAKDLIYWFGTFRSVGQLLLSVFSSVLIGKCFVPAYTHFLFTISRGVIKILNNKIEYYIAVTA